MSAPTSGSGADAIPGAVAAIAGGIDRGLHLGGQVYVSLKGAPVAHLGIGEARAGGPLTPASRVPGFSITNTRLPGCGAPNPE